MITRKRQAGWAKNNADGDLDDQGAPNSACFRRLIRTTKKDKPK